VNKEQNDIAIRVENLSKCYQIYDTPRDRLKQFILPRLHHLTGQTPRQYFREFWALKDISFDVKKGETIGIIGRNGSGKSTLLQLICGTLSPTSGSITTNGRIAALLELGSGFNPEFTGRENVYMNASVLGLSQEEIDARFDDIAAFADIGDFIEQPVKTYSSGMMMRLGFAVAINIDPQILIVDEALSVGDELFQRKCFSRIEAIKAKGATILFVSHSGSQVVELCDRALLIDAGERLLIGEPKSTVMRYQKLLYAPSESRDTLREAIRNQINEVAAFPTKDDKNLQEANYNQDSEDVLGDEGEYFDPALQPASTLTYESRGVQIISARIESLNGKQLNNLVRGKRYIYRYQVLFEKTAEYVRFGMALRSSIGVHLGGQLTAGVIPERVPLIMVGQLYEVVFEFQCNLNPGVYFTDAGVYALCNEEELLMHRIMDLVSFRVIPVTSDTGNGPVWLSATAKLIWINKSN